MVAKLVDEEAAAAKVAAYSKAGTTETTHSRGDRVVARRGERTPSYGGGAGDRP